MKKILLGSIMCVLILNACIYQAEKRPLPRDNEVWVCENPHIELYWDNTYENINYGLIEINNTRYEIFHKEGAGSKVFIQSIDGAEVYNETEKVKEYLLFKSRANYNYDTFTLQVEEDRVNMFDGELPLLKFKCYKKSEYFKDKKGDK